MSKYRAQLPMLGKRLFMADGGIETTLIFLEHQDLPLFSAVTLLKDEAGTEKLYQYFCRFAEMARGRKLGLMLESATWRASPDWGRQLGYDEATLADLNRKSIDLLVRVRERYETETSPMVISGVLGPRGDGYRPDQRMSVDEAAAYHDWQIGIFADTEADLVVAYTLNYLEEALGIAKAAQSRGMPVALSFTLETDGRLPTGEELRQAIETVDQATRAYPAYYMVNCAHPSHFAHVLQGSGAWLKRIRGVRANASKRSHAELDNSPDLDIGNPQELGRDYQALQRRLPALSIVGGCCGTDYRHIEAICRAVTARQPETAEA